ncbi:hypothetical protein SDRG_09581 [Saprolegnia diclina VS20]|uniref:Rap-GAP domain-containing protein n=1 Tax=Saprolegnia diclina (strain VS20) TaxID=1156394 RepID=T0RSE8_SAPDV|nr:hypothetical protein SDRG_09581 [Saprolegnia diclina VS20]EQC33062.1 hypothetical protein SDRG_09581 [Saprolegnia diclina VS20]|eukprot:XP_008613748.1 hypothetical protein SDRG_09581 [Saprolegnia diclina VS20]
MFLSWVGKCELLHAPPEAHVLKGFNESCQRGICSMVIGFLGAGDEADVLATPTHVKWSMEALGHSFALGMEDADVISGATRIYEKWLGLHGDGRPKCMLGQEQEFIRDLLGHMSLIFEDRDATRGKPELLAKHISLCEKVLDLYSLLGRKRAATLTPTTWDHFLRLLLGITDCVLHGNKHSLASALCGQLIRVTLEQFTISLQFTGVKGDLWNMLLKFCRRWLHRKTVIEQWNVISYALTEQLMARLAADALATTTATSHVIEIPWSDRTPTQLELESALLAYAWYRIMRVIGHPSLFVDPDVYLVAISGIRRLANVLTYVAPATSDEKQPQLPDVNTVLRILGPWLFDASLNRTGLPRFALCRAEAVRCLGDLLSQHGGGRTKQVTWPFTIRALMAIQKALLEDDDVLVASAVASCSRIFGTHGTHTLRGVGVLAGSFHHAIDRIFKLSATKSPSVRKESASGASSPRKRLSVGDEAGGVSAIGGVPITLLRRACIEACSSLLTIHSHLPISITKQVEKSLTGHVDGGLPLVYSSLPRYQSSNVVTLLIGCLKSEVDSTNQQMAMWLLTIAVQKEALFWSMGLASTRNSQVPMTITSICSFLTKIPSRWKPACVFTALECLRYLTIVSEHLYKHVFSSCVYLISCVCEFMASNAQALRTMRSPPVYVDQLIASAMGCLLEWIVTTPQLLSKTQIMVKIIATVVDCADYRKEFVPLVPHADDATRQSAHEVLEYLVKHHANTATDARHSVLDDDEHTQSRYFVWNHGTLVGLLEGDDGGLAVSLRDASGHYAWRVKAQYRYTPLGAPAPSPPVARPTRTSSFYTYQHDAEMDMDGETMPTDPLLQTLRQNAPQLTNWSSSSSATLDASEGNLAKRDVETFVQLLQAQREAEEMILAQHAGEASGPEPLEAPRPTTAANDARRLLSQLGFISIGSWGSFFPLTNSAGLLADLRALDRLPTRETYEIGIAYTVNGPSVGGFDSISTLDQTSTPSPSYAAFVATMGWTVDVGTYGGFLGHSPRETGQALVYAQYNYEVAFYTPTLAAHRPLLANAEVLIVWNECQQKYTPGSALWASAYGLPHPRASVYIIIDPLDEGLFCVRISVAGSVFESDAGALDEDTFAGRVLGPLQDGMVISGEWLGPLVRQTALNAVHVHRLQQRHQHSLGLSTQSPIRPQDKRTKLIAGVVRDHVAPLLPGEFYSSLFPPTSA